MDCRFHVNTSFCSLLFLFFTFFFPDVLLAQFDFSTEESVNNASYAGGPKRGKSLNQIWRAGIIIEPGSALKNVKLSLPVPMNWFEQQVLSVNEEKTDAEIAARIEYRIVHGGATEMMLNIGNVRANKRVEIVLSFELKNYELLPPDNPGDYIIPKKIPKEYRQYLRESPCIESDNPKFIKMFQDITKDRQSAWDKVEALYSFVQNNVKYDDDGWRRQALGALAVTKMPKGQWKGDCKDMSCLFVALCRAGNIPARIIRVPEHCYAEFYLEHKPPKKTAKNEKSPKKEKEKDKNSSKTPSGFWFPCQVSGTYAFGGVPEQRVILQKGDSYLDPDNEPHGKTLWLRECFRGDMPLNSPNPKFKWIHEAEAAK
ncbi:transglutaminase [Planctomycetales bacterium]|nr:transglutaminase [Planctomycetales bacterium]